jgi:fucose permease
MTETKQGRFTYRWTLIASYAGYITQAIVNNLAPLLFVTFQRQFAVSLGSLALLISLNFGVQLLIDLAATQFVDKIGYRAAAVGAHIFCAAGLVLMGILPFALPNPWWGLAIAVVINAIGGGLLEVIVSPIVESLPTENKASAMSLLHSFYCWGYVVVVVLSTLYFNLAGIDNWPYLPMLWAALPLANIFLFAVVPLRTLIDENAVAVPLRSLFTKKVFLIVFLMMICAGASEQAMSQWASLFAESGLGVSKTMGDLLGPCAFALMMGLGRVFFSLQKVKLERILLAAGCLCIVSYLVTVFAPLPMLALAGCTLCGLSVSVMWPGTFSLASRVFPLGGTAMFAILALAGDLGCGSGPALVGIVMSASALNTGLLAALLFPVLLVAGIMLLKTPPRPPQRPPPLPKAVISILVVLFMVTACPGRAQDLDLRQAAPGEAPAKPEPAESADLSGLIGLPLRDLIGEYALPTGVNAVRGKESWQDDVAFSYNGITLFVAQNRVWQLSVPKALGVSVGDRREEALVALGTGADNNPAHILYPINDRPWPIAARFNIDETGKVEHIYIYRSDF